MSSSPGTASPLRLSKINSKTSGTNRSESILLMLLLNFIISLCGMACLYVSAICSNGSYVKHEDGSSIKWSGDLRYSRWIQNRKCDFSWPTSSTLHDSSWAQRERERERERERAILRATPPRIMYQNDSYKGTRLEINANSNHEPSLFSIWETPGL